MIKLFRKNRRKILVKSPSAGRTGKFWNYIERYYKRLIGLPKTRHKKL